jgi:hypothetical protein
MRSWICGAVVVAAARVALAQPAPPDPVAPPALTPAPSPAAAPSPAPSPAPSIDNPSPAAPVTPARPEEPRSDTGRPTELAFAIGAGYALPTSLQTPNTTSVRIRLPGGLTFEPQLVFATTSDDMATSSSQQRELTVGSLVRYPLRVRHKVDLELVGDARFSIRLVDPDGDSNNRTTTTVDLGYGVAIAYWFTAHWNFSLTASNPLLAFARTRQETGVGRDTTTRTTTFGLVVDPQVTLMIHLYD